jgi:predicted dithiol-disulfide oxidoreductase (DUF899 family)
MSQHKVVSQSEWVEARKALLALSEARRALPWARVEKEYVFEGPRGKETLAALFDGRSQLVVYHFMFEPSWDAGCKHCSFWADNFDPNIIHLQHRDVTMVAVSRAPYDKLAAYEKRMGWTFKWLSSFGSDFNRDFGVAFTPEELAAKKADYNFKLQDPFMPEREGLSVFYKDETGKIFRTYSAYARGIDIINTAYNILDLVPKGRDEAEGNQHWVRRHDEYDR